MRRSISRNKQQVNMFLAASTGGVIAATVVAFLLTLVLVGLLLFAKKKLSPSGR